MMSGMPHGSVKCHIGHEMITMAPTWEIVAFLDQVPYRSFTRAVVGERLRWGFLNLQTWLLAIPQSAWELPIPGVALQMCLADIASLSW